jgi:sulfite reductase alpha subunit
LGLEIDPNMILHPRTNPYIRTDGWDEEAEKWFARKAEAAAGHGGGNLAKAA